jgi:hypothetical protein
MVETAAADEAYIVVALRIGMIRDPGSDTRIETGPCGRRRVLRQGIERVGFGENVVDLNIGGVELFRRELAQRAKPTE